MGKGRGDFGKEKYAVELFVGYTADMDVNMEDLEVCSIPRKYVRLDIPKTAAHVAVRPSVLVTVKR